MAATLEAAGEDSEEEMEAVPETEGELQVVVAELEVVVVEDKEDREVVVEEEEGRRRRRRRKEGQVQARERRLRVQRRLPQAVHEALQEGKGFRRTQVGEVGGAILRGGERVSGQVLIFRENILNNLLSRLIFSCSYRGGDCLDERCNAFFCCARSENGRSFCYCVFSLWTRYSSTNYGNCYTFNSAMNELDPASPRHAKKAASCFAKSILS